MGPASVPSGACSPPNTRRPRQFGRTRGHSPIATNSPSWAVPLNRAAPGQLWAFFPTVEETTLSGVLNAPWKLNADRSRLVEGPFNRELLKAAVELAVSALPQVARKDDPGFVLELLPGRGKELRGWADQVISEAAYMVASALPCVPDLSGRLRPPAALSVNTADVPLEATRRWAATEGRPNDWVHPSAVQSTTRRSRVDRLFDLVHVPPTATWAWLQKLLEGADPVAASARAIHVAVEIVGSPEDPSMRKARIVASEGGEFVVPVAGSVYLPADIEVDLGVPLVHRTLASDLTTAPELQGPVLQRSTRGTS